MEILLNTENRIIIKSSNSIPGYIFEENKNTNSKIYTPLFMTTLFTIARYGNNLWSSTDEWIMKRGIVEYYSATIKDEILLFTMHLDLEDIMLGEISKAEKDKYSMLPFTCRI